MVQVKLSEILHSQMDILFVGLNPPQTSNSNGHYFSGSMSFWNLLYNSGLIIQEVRSPLTGDLEVFKYNKINYKNKIFGVTDLVSDLVQTNSSKVKTTQEEVKRIIELIDTHEVKNLCLIHSKVGKVFRAIPGLNSKQRYGLIGRIKNTNVYEMPFHNASIPDKDEEYKKLLKALDL